MRYMSFINMTAAEVYEWHNVISILLKLEIFGLVYSIGSTLLCFRLLFWTAQYHMNLNWLFASYAGQYLFSICSRIGLILIQLRDDSSPSLLSDTLMYIRTTCVVTALISIASIVVERTFATILVKDYESKKRRWIPCLLLFLTYSVSIPAGYLFCFGLISREIAVFFTWITNIAMVIISLTAEKCSRRQYDLLTRSIHPHSTLGWRYQQVENIKSWEVLRYVLIVICFFNILSGLCLLSPTFDFHDMWPNFSAIIFDYCLMTYGIVIPYVMLYFNKLWQREVVRILRMLKMDFFLPSDNDVKPHLKTTDGMDMTFTAEEENKRHFNQLKSEWDVKYKMKNKC